MEEQIVVLLKQSSKKTLDTLLKMEEYKEFHKVIEYILNIV